MKVTLEQFLLHASQTLPLLTYINTDNDTFPAEFRYSDINLFTLISQGLNDSIRYREIDHINNSPDLHLYIMGNKFNSDIRPVNLSIYLKPCTISNIN